MDEELHSMKIEETEIRMTKAKITQKYYPGFACFFDHYLKAASITFKQCYENLLTSHHQIQILSNPLQKILKTQNETQEQVDYKKNKLIQRTSLGQQFMHFTKSVEDSSKLDESIIDYTNRQEEEAWRLELRLEEYQRIKQSLIEEKRAEFERRRVEQEARRKEIEEMKKKQMSSEMKKQT